MNEKLYNLLVDGGVFTHGIGDIKDYLPFDYFVGIVIPNDEKIKKEVINILIQYDIELLVYDIEGNEIKYSRKIK